MDVMPPLSSFIAIQPPHHSVSISNYYSNMTTSAGFERLREQAILLRRAGKSRREISELLGIGSNRTLNEALRGEPPQP
jgi:hypothetical protein